MLTTQTFLAVMHSNISQCFNKLSMQPLECKRAGTTMNMDGLRVRLTFLPFSPHWPHTCSLGELPTAGRRHQLCVSASPPGSALHHRPVSVSSLARHAKSNVSANSDAG